VILAHISDPHVSTRDWAAADALGLAVRALLDLRPRPDAVLLSGDVATGADPREYARTAEMLGLLDVPVHVVPGNHDEPERLAAALGVPVAPFAAEVAGVRLLGLSTHVPGSDAGALGAEQLDWLRDALAGAPDAPTLVALHHPPIEVALPEFDAIRLDPDDARVFAELIAGAPQVIGVVGGHVHRTIFGTVGGRPFAVCPSTYLQSRLVLDGGPIELIPGPPALLLHVWRDGTLVTHVQPI
jgi:3',5'-cyclic-AMP phosphodiesterase